MKRSLNDLKVDPRTKFIRYPRSGLARLIGVIALLIGIISLNVWVTSLGLSQGEQGEEVSK